MAGSPFFRKYHVLTLAISQFYDKSRHEVFAKIVLLLCFQSLRHTPPSWPTETTPYGKIWIKRLRKFRKNGDSEYLPRHMRIMIRAAMVRKVEAGASRSGTKKTCFPVATRRGRRSRQVSFRVPIFSNVLSFNSNFTKGIHLRWLAG